jgi:hypothetical protein
MGCSRNSASTRKGWREDLTYPKSRRPVALVTARPQKFGQLVFSGENLVEVVNRRCGIDPFAEVAPVLFNPTTQNVGLVLHGIMIGVGRGFSH